MEVVDHRKDKCCGLTVDDMGERDVFHKTDDRRPPRNGHLYMLVRPNANRNVELRALDINCINVVNIQFGTIHAMKMGTPVQRLHVALHIRDECGHNRDCNYGRK